ncbi:hypothetical protein [Mobiluncus porci]|uniref:Uncharacterized protein n=1 Tax=Mobiluncus porci TaxID=2652278 RepID=A0A7K0K0D7_9ACTO|nr:hypothetical protein [Mobiluncus porci]MST48952.1 hypothetical protein [Mobiluncus porci]
MEITYESETRDTGAPVRNMLIGFFIGIVTLMAQTYLITKSPALADLLMNDRSWYGIAYAALDIVRTLIATPYSLFLLRKRMDPDSYRPFALVALSCSVGPWIFLQAYVLFLSIRAGNVSIFDFLWGALLSSLVGAALAMALVRPR